MSIETDENGNIKITKADYDLQPIEPPPVILHTHGGKRTGAGRPKGTTGAYKEEKAKAHQIKMTDREWEIYQKAGGTKNLRRLIHLGKFRKII